MRNALRPRLVHTILSKAGLLALPSAAGATIEVTGATLRVTLGVPTTSTSGNGVQVLPLAGGGAIVSPLRKRQLRRPERWRRVSAGRQRNAGAMPSDFPGGGAAAFVATCDLTSVRIVEGRSAAPAPAARAGSHH